jgi:hypothetical protein
MVVSRGILVILEFNKPFRLMDARCGFQRALLGRRRHDRTMKGG